MKISRAPEMSVLLVICVGSSILGFIFWNTKAVTARSDKVLSLPQSDEKMVERTKFPEEPFQFDDLGVKNIKIALSQKFSANSIAEVGGGQVEDWLENLNFTLKNTAHKQMTYINIEMDFPETKVNGPMMVYNQLGMGIHPQDISRHATPLALEPGDKTTFTLSDHHLQMIKSFLAVNKFSLSDINKVVIRIDYIIFDDGMKWSQGDYYKPNPSARGGYERVNSSTQ